TRSPAPIAVRREGRPMEYSPRAPMPVSCAEAGRRGFVLEWTAIGALVTALSLVAPAHGAFAACGDNPADANAVAAARQAADSQCDCATVKTHHRYVRCVAGVAQAAVSSGTLSEECKAQLVGCAAAPPSAQP